MDYVFPPSSTEVSFCLVVRPYGTRIQVTVDWLGCHVVDGLLYRKCEIEYRGGKASSETGYRHWFVNYDGRQDVTVQKIEAQALELAERHFKELHPKRQLEMF